MREILFKAKRLDNGEWVEGFYHYSNYIYPETREHAFTKHYILPIDSQDAYEVNSDTLCQYTGMNDKNSEKIWENDIVNKIDVNTLGWHRERKGKISFNNLGYWLLTTEFGDGYWLGEFNSEQIEVMGNVFDNSELMERSE